MRKKVISKVKKLFTLSLIIAAMAVLIGWNKYRGSLTVVTVNTEIVTEQALSDSILASGNLIFNNQIQIRTEVTGIVTEVFVEEGESVEKGQLLINLDQTSFNADVANFQSAANAQKIQIEQAEESLADLQRRLALNEKMFSQNLVSLEEVDSLRSQTAIAEIQVKAAKEMLNQNLANLALSKDRLKKTTFVASMSGLISSVDVKTGETVIAGTTNIIGSSLMTLADPSIILAELRIDEADIASVKIGQEVKVYAASDPKTAITGNVTSIGTSARTNQNGYGLHFRVKALLATPERLYPGMSCRAEIITHKNQSSLSVPIAAVQKEDDEYFVWLVKDDVVNRKTVTVGMANDTHQAIQSGLSEKDVVVIGPSRLVKGLTDGTRIKESQHEGV